MAKRGVFGLMLAAGLVLALPVAARPRYRQNLKQHYGERLAAALDACTTCHLRKEEVADPLAFEKKPPHNPFGVRLRVLGEELKAKGEAWDLAARLRLAALEDADGDGFANELEILAGRAPGDPRDAPAPAEARRAEEAQRALAGLRGGYPWAPFRPVRRPGVPEVTDRSAVRNPIDAFIAREHESRGLVPRPEAPRPVLLRRLHLDLTGLPPRPEELRAFLDDPAADAYERAVDRLLASPLHGERWGRHWMDVWRYSDWAGWGNQVRDSQPHVWRWRDWIVESLNADKGYDLMVMEMLAGDEIAPLDRDALRATGYLARSFKLLSREAWMQEAVDHAAQAFLGLTVGCARCHDHMFDPISQREYYRFRAIFEPYGVRLDRLPGQPDTGKDGLARAFDAEPAAATYLFIRGDDRNPDKDQPLSPGVPEALGGPELPASPVPVPLAASVPEKAEWLRAEAQAAAVEAAGAAREKLEAAVLAAARAEKALAESARAGSGGSEPEPAKAREALERAREDAEVAGMALPAAEAARRALEATVRVERMEDAGAREKDPEGWKQAATEAASLQRLHRLLDARRGERAQEIAVARARAASAAASRAAEAAKEDRKLAEAAKKAAAELQAAEKQLAEVQNTHAEAKEKALLPPAPEYQKRELKTYPATSTGRRLALARWIADPKNPLAARVAVNHIWLRHFGQALVPTVSDFGAGGRPPSHPALLDWLAAEFMEPTVATGARPWSMKALHRLIATSAAYRRSSTPDEGNLAADPDNRWLWRMNSRRLEAEVVRDSVLHVAGSLDLTRGGPELDQGACLTTRRRSLYYRHAPEKQPEFLQIFDMAAPGECYERKASVVPQQALALANSPLVAASARELAKSLAARAGPDPARFAAAAFEEALARPATPAEVEASVRFLVEGGSGAAPDAAGRARELLVHALLNHNDFVTVR